MSYVSRRVVAQIARLGKEADVLTRNKSGTNEFGNSEYSDYTKDRTVLAFKTYPNRNTEVESDIGTYERDNPVFMVPKGPNQPKPPQEDDRISFDGSEYKVSTHTEYETHVEFFGDVILDG